MRKIKFLLFFIIILITIPLPVYGIEKSITTSLNSDEAMNISFQNKANITSNLVEYKEPYISVRLNIPIISGLNNNEVQKAINNRIQNTITSVRDSVETMAKEDAEMNKNTGYDIRQYEIKEDYNVTYNKNNILSLTLIIYQYTGGAHGSTTQLTYNFDLNTGKVGVLKDFFGNNENYRNIIFKEIRKEIEKEPGNYFPETLKNFNGIPYDQPFYLEDQDVVVYFSEYEIAPYAAGRPEFKIPYSVFPKGIKTKVNIAEDPVAVQTETSINRQGNFQSYLQYPKISNMKSEILMKKINDIIKDDVFKFSEEIKLKSKESQNENTAEGKEKTWGASTYFKNYYVNENLMSIDVTFSADNGTTESYDLYSKGYNINLDSGKIYKLKDVFKNGVDYISLLNEEINSQIQEINKKMGYKNIYNFKTINENTQFYIEKGNLVITFPLGKIAPKEYYTPEFIIPLNKISKYINEEFIEK